MKDLYNILDYTSVPSRDIKYLEEVYKDYQWIYDKTELPIDDLINKLHKTYEEMRSISHQYYNVTPSEGIPQKITGLYLGNLVAIYEHLLSTLGIYAKQIFLCTEAYKYDENFKNFVGKSIEACTADNICLTYNEEIAELTYYVISDIEAEICDYINNGNNDIVPLTFRICNDITPNWRSTYVEDTYTEPAYVGDKCIGDKEVPYTEPLNCPPNNALETLDLLHPR